MPNIGLLNDWRDGEKWLECASLTERLGYGFFEKLFDPETGILARTPKFSAELFQAGWVFGEIRTDRVAKFAEEALTAGYDGPALRRLAALSKDDTQDLPRFLAPAFVELGLSAEVSKEQSGLCIAKALARAALDEEIHPYIAARLIWKRVYRQCESLEQLLPFVGLASEYEDDPQHRSEHEQDISEELENLLRSFT
jgi:hypothetical protein